MDHMLDGRQTSLNRTWRVAAERAQAYEIRVAEPLLDPANSALRETGRWRTRCFVVLDAGLPCSVRGQISQYFLHYSVSAEFLTLPGGETSKDFDTLQRLLAAFDHYGLNRRTEPVIIVGGGSVLDVASFAASVYRRGVPFVRVPTTLLSYVDASIGVKTAINLGHRKNRVGSFAPPFAVFLDTGFLYSLDYAEIASGLGEILKLALGCDAPLLDMLEASEPAFRARHFADPAVRAILQRAIDLMLRELSGNLYEEDLCRVVDLGHTFSQVFEFAERGPGLRHGEAVAIDLNLTAIIAMHRGLLSATEAARLARLTAILGLPMHIPHPDADRLWESVVERTAHRGGQQRFPLPVRLGECTFINDLRHEEVARALREFQLCSSTAAAMRPPPKLPLHPPRVSYEDP